MKIGIPIFPRYRRRFSGVGAFSLTEVVIALGIFSFATMGILGVLPTAVTTIRDASQQQIISDILTQVGADLRSVSGGGGTAAGDDFPRYYDVRGVFLGGGSVVPRDAIYRVDFAGSGPIAHDGQSLNPSLHQVSVALEPIHGGAAPIVMGVGVPKP